MTNRFRFAAVLASALALVGCDQAKSITSPTSITQATATTSTGPTVDTPPSTSNPTPPSPTPGNNPTGASLCEASQGGVRCEVVRYDLATRVAEVRFTNVNAADGTQVNLTAYKMYAPPPDWGAQEAFMPQGHAETRLARGGSQVLRISLPTCRTQVDAYIGPFVERPPHANGILLGYVDTGGALCDPPPPPPVPLGCEGVSAKLAKTEAMDATRVSGKVVVSFSGGSAKLRDHQGNLQTVRNGQEFPFEFARPATGQPDQRHEAHLEAFNAEGKSCARDTTVVLVPAVVPQPPTCEGVVATLVQGSVELTESLYKTSITASVTGQGATSSLVIDGAETSFTNGQSVPVSILRPAFGAPAKTVNVSLTPKVGSTSCSPKTLSFVVEPKSPPQPTCEGTSSSLVKSGEVVLERVVGGKLTITLSGEAVTGRLKKPDGSTVSVKNGESIEYEFERPAYGQGDQVKVYVLERYVDGKLCGTNTVEVKVPQLPPPARTCENVAARLSAKPGELGSTFAEFVFSPQWQGAGSGNLAFGDGQGRGVTSGQTVTYRYVRPKFGDLPKRYSPRLVVVEGDLECKAEVQIEVKPQDCSVSNPPSFSKTGGSVMQKGETVWVAGHYRVANQQNVSVGILWRNGNDLRVKVSKPVNLTCEKGAEEGSLTWDSSYGPHLPSKGARYSLVLFRGSEASPQILAEHPLQ